MMVLVSYDVDTCDAAGAKRLRNVAKICESYGCRVQNSVFELLIDPAQCVSLKERLNRIINPDKDSVRIYRLGSNWHGKIEVLGRQSLFEQDGLILL